MYSNSRCITAPSVPAAFVPDGKDFHFTTPQFPQCRPPRPLPRQEADVSRRPLRQQEGRRIRARQSRHELLGWQYR